MSPSSLEYKLVKLFVFENNSCKMSKNWTFKKNIGLGLNFTYEFEVCYRQCQEDIFKKDEFISQWNIKFMNNEPVYRTPGLHRVCKNYLI